MSVAMSVNKTKEIDASGIYYRDLNEMIREAVGEGARKIVLTNVAGQRYIGTNLYDAAPPEELEKIEFEIHGTPGNDLGMFMDGPTVTVHGNVMDGSGNTMNRGRIIAHGRAGDITGFSARGGELFIRDGAGYRVGIHMKEYKEKRPVMVIGGSTQDFLGEYMAGGVIIVMCQDLEDNDDYYASHVGTGMHGGVIFLRSQIPDYKLGGGVGAVELTDMDIEVLDNYVKEYGAIFDADVSKITPNQFTKLVPLSTRPYKNLYAY